MKRRNFIILFLLVFFCFESAYSQKVKVRQANFAGIWNLDLSRSKFNAPGKMMLEELKNYSRQVIIEQNFPAIKITTNERWDGWEKDALIDYDLVTQNYFADGRGDNEPIDLKVSTSKSVSKIVGEKLIITLYGLDDYNRTKVSMVTEYSVSDNGNTLIQVVKPGILMEANKFEDLTNSYFLFTRAK